MRSINLFLIKHKTGNLTLRKILNLKGSEMSGCFVQSIDTADQLYRLVSMFSKEKPNAIIYRPYSAPELIIDYTKEKAQLDYSKFATKGTAQLTLNFKHNE